MICFFTPHVFQSPYKTLIIHQTPRPQTTVWAEMSRIVETHPFYGYIRGSQFDADADADMDEGDVEQWSVGISHTPEFPADP